MYDNLAILQTAVTKTATFQGTGYDLKTGTPRRGMKARFLISSYGSGATAGATFTPSIEESSDNTTFNTVAATSPLTGGTAATGNECWVEFVTEKRYIRPVITISAATSHTPSIAYAVDLGLSKP